MKFIARLTASMPEVALPEAGLAMLGAMTPTPSSQHPLMHGRRCCRVPSAADRRQRHRGFAWRSDLRRHAAGRSGDARRGPHQSGSGRRTAWPVRGPVDFCTCFVLIGKARWVVDRRISRGSRPSAQRRAADRLAAPHPQRPCRAAHLPCPRQSLRQRPRRAGGLAGPRPPRRRKAPRARPVTPECRARARSGKVVRRALDRAGRAGLSASTADDR